MTRKIIYVDASWINVSCSILSLYDSNNKCKKAVVVEGIKNSNESEKMAVMFALHYIDKRKKGKNNTYHILTDNLSVSKDLSLIKSINKVCNKKINISWIPREINTVADSFCKKNRKKTSISLNIFSKKYLLNHLHEKK